MIFASDLILGSHLNVSCVGKGERYFLGYYDTALELGMSAFQFQLGSCQSFKRKRVDMAWLDAIQNYSDFNMCVFSHAPYIHNLAGSTRKLAPSYTTTIPASAQHHFNSLSSLAYELDVLSHFNGGVVIHAGSHSDTEAALDRIAESINFLSSLTSSIDTHSTRDLVLENSAGEGTKLPVTFEHFARIFNGVADTDSVSVCLDTCHTFASGLYDLSDERVVDAMFRDFDRTVGQRLSVIHLNDSKTPFESHRDRHQSIGLGYIWGESTRSLETLFSICQRRKIPLILETPTPTQDIFFIHQMLA